MQTQGCAALVSLVRACGCYADTGLGCLSARRRDHARTQRMSSSAGSASHSGPDRYCGLVLMQQGITTLVRTPYALGYIAKERLPQAPGDDHGATLPCRGLEGIQSRSSVGGYR